jgi:WD40 repeat protein
MKTKCAIGIFFVVLFLFVFGVFAPFKPFLPLPSRVESVSDQHSLLVFKGTMFTSRLKTATDAVFVLDLDTNELMQWLPLDETQRVSWSSQQKGKALLIDQAASEAYFIYITKEASKLPSLSLAEGDYVLSPSGEWIAFSRGGVLCLENLEDLSITRLDKHNTLDLKMSWSPDGKYLALVSVKSQYGGQDYDNPSFFVYKIDVDRDELGLHVLTEELPGFGDANPPKWSPDGKWIVFSQYRARINHLWIIRTTVPQRLVHSPSPEGFLGDYAWSPDSTKLAFVFSEPLQASSLWVWDIVDNQVRQIIPPDSSEKFWYRMETLTWVSNEQVVLSAAFSNDKWSRCYIFGSEAARACTYNLFLVDTTTEILTQLTQRQFTKISNLTYWK